MGSSIAANLQASGFHVIGIEVNPATRKQMSSRIAKVGASPRMLVGKTGHILTSLPSVAALMAVCEELAAEATAQGIASGETAAIKQMMDVFKGFSRAQFSVGEFGNGMKMKLVANLLVAIHNVSTAEAILFGQQLGLQAKAIVEVVADGAGGSRMFQVRGPMMASRGWDDATMKIEVWQKDMSIIDDALRALNLPSPLFAACIPIYRAAMAQGHALHDTAAVYAVLEKFAGES